MKNHYYPWGFDDDAERAPCGTWFGETSNVTSNWAYVTCKHCIRRKDTINKSIELDESVIVEQMGSMVDSAMQAHA